MTILFDLAHPAHVNFSKTVIGMLDREGHKIIVTYRPRGRLKTIVECELGRYSPVAIGRHSKSVVMKVAGQILRDLHFVPFLIKRKVDLSVGTSTNAIGCRLAGVPHIALEDDIEYKIPFYMGAIFCSRHIMPDYLEYQGKKVRRYHGVKELAYLHPAYFTPSPAEPAKYGLRPEEYIFVRKVSGVSLNYRGEDTLSLKCLREIQQRTGLKILMSLEDKALAEQAARDFILLEEPVDDIHSLMAFARFTISSGDSMPRESCVLGTPAIYTGGRDMKINHELIALGCLHKEDTPDLVLKRVEVLAASDEKRKTSAVVRDKIRDEWEDINLMLLSNIMDFAK